MEQQQNRITAVDIDTAGSYVRSKQITITDELNCISFPALIHHPTLEHPVPVVFGPYQIENGIFAEKFSFESIAVMGHSMGGYTALAFAGGVPYTRAGKEES